MRAFEQFDLLCQCIKNIKSIHLLTLKTYGVWEFHPQRERSLKLYPFIYLIKKWQQHRHMRFCYHHDKQRIVLYHYFGANNSNDRIQTYFSSIQHRNLTLVCLLSIHLNCLGLHSGCGKLVHNLIDKFKLHTFHGFYVAWMLGPNVCKNSLLPWCCCMECSYWQA